MYEAFFQLHGRPFLAAPQTARYFPASVIEGARRTLCRSIERAEGAGLIIGPSGTGKTLLCQMLAEEFAGRFAVALLTGGRLSSRQALLQAILYELGLPYRGLDEGELRLTLLDHLEPKHASHEGLLLVIDEAHTLPWRLLEEVRMLTNLVRDGQPRVRVVLAGSPTLEERFASPNLSSFAQRLAARCYLEPLDSVETADYVRSQVSAVGGDAQLFQEDALRSIYRATDGVPRLINQVCDHALILAGLGGMSRLTSDAIEEAWADLQQLPSPWAAARKETAASQIVEFGHLDDLQDEPREAIPFRSAAPRQLQVAEPEEQLDQIAEQLSTIEDAFQPAGSIGTEVEIDFPEFGDPFGEEFVEEEVVLERYSPDSDIFSTAPRVSSWEGQQLGSLLKPLDAAEPWTVGKKPAIVDVGDTVDDALPQADDATDPPRPQTPPAPDQAALRSLENPVAAVRKESLSAVERSQADESDLIVVEDETRVAGTSTKPAPDARPQKLEYRQLFAKLRRG